MALARSCTLDANTSSMCKVAGVAVFELSEGARMLQILQGAYDPFECAFRGGFKVDMFGTSASACDGFVELGSSRHPVTVGG